ncbi:carboxylesterase notum2 [Erpetoichthys calabaricus]|uniref:carboxylesterase notum2 n=1 Tax=Erpetoichthys calabaricus TaxID=27687 RepID=UPI002233EB54|nr:carboxylesterase notum2 [Erpetoichthys calabaricus]
MNCIGHLVILLLLGEVASQSKRTKPGSKVPSQGRKTINPGTSDDETLAPDSISGDDKKELVESQAKDPQNAAHQIPKSGDDMKLHFLKNTQVTCNDGTVAGFYYREYKGSKRWLVFLEGGWCCYNKETCDSRYKNSRRLMSSTEWPSNKKGSGILSNQPEENPQWWNANIVFIPYCSSDVWSGTSPKSRTGKETGDYAFMGSHIIREVIKDLIPKGMKQAKVIMLAGTSAGGTGVLLNIEKVSSLLEQLGAEAQVRGLVDSGWFLESKQQQANECTDATSCSPTDAIKKGLRLWNGIVPEKCRQQFKKGEEWQCFLGHKLYSSIKSPVFVVQWLFDEEQLRVENINFGSQSLTEHQWTSIQNLGRELKNSLRDVQAAFAPSCLSHTLITKSNWMDFQVKGTSLNRALQCWDKSLQEASKNNKAPIRGCPFHLIDNCQWPQCNPTCPPLVDQRSGQEMSLSQILIGMGLDVHKLAQELKVEVSHLLGMISNGG